MPIIFFLFLSGCQDKTVNEEVSEDPFPESGIMEGITEAHNQIRRAHGVPDLTWDQDMVDLSIEWIEYLDQENNCEMEHNWDSPYGENLFWATYETTNDVVVESWASEEEYYNYDTNECAEGEMCGHYTQIVWEETKLVGCAMTICGNNGGYLWMCNYDPIGNIVGQQPY